MVRSISVLDTSEARELEQASHRLAQIPAGGDPVEILDAIASTTGVEAGMLGVFEVRNPHAMSNRPLRLPPELLQGWLSTAPEFFARSLAPAVSLPEGAFWCESDSLMRDSREGLKVLRDLDAHDLGQGAGHKVMECRTPGRSTDYTFLALMTRRGKVFSPRVALLLAELQPALRDAVCRLALPLLPNTSILRQIVDEDQQGYVCLSSSSTVMEVNRRAYDVAMTYRSELRLDRRSHLLEDLAARVIEAGGKGLQAIRKDRREVLDIRAHHLAKETHALPEDVNLLVLRTLEIPAPEEVMEEAHPEHPELSALTPTQRRVAKFLLNTAHSRKEIAAEMGIAEGTVRKHMENLYERLDVRSRAELAMLVRGKKKNR